MESKGRIISFRPDTINNKTQITIEINTSDDSALQDIERLMKSDIKAHLVTYREPRSKDSNAYFHVLSDKLADAMRMSKPKMKNYLLFHYGQKVRDEDGKLVLIKTNANEEDLITRTDIHLWYYKDSEQDGVPMYVLLEHSRFFDSRQMSILIDGVVAECKAVGIETLPPEEIIRLKVMWDMEVNHGKM